MEVNFPGGYVSLRQRCGEDGFVVVRAPYTDVDVKVPCSKPKDAEKNMPSNGRKMLQDAVNVTYPGGYVYVGKECGSDGFVVVQAPSVNTEIKVPCNKPVNSDDSQGR
jgi:hypothetical protein